MRIVASLVAFAVMLVCAPLAAHAALPDTAKEPGARVALVLGQAEFLGPEAEAWRPAEPNLVLQPGDRLRTAAESRVELQFEGGALVRLGAASETELLAVGESPAVRLVAGRAYFRAPRGDQGTLAVEAGDRRVGAADGAAFRVDLEGGAAGAAITVTAGQIAVEASGGRVELARGERLEDFTRGPVPATLLARDDFDRWNADRDAALARAVPDGYAPRHLPGLADLDRHGSWVLTDDYGYVWRPSVAPDWHPYLYGRWVYRPYYGWCWVAAEPWGWTPYHYGRWVDVAAFGWVWVPGTVFTTVVVAAPFVVSTVIVSPPPVIVHSPVVVVPPVVVVRRPVVVVPPVVVRRPVVVSPRVVAPRVVSPPVVVAPPAVVEPRRRIIRAFPQAMESGGGLRSVSRGSSAPLLTTSPPALAQPPTGAPAGDTPRNLRFRGDPVHEAPRGGPAGLRSTGPAAVNSRPWRAVPGGGSVGRAAPVARSGSAWMAAPAPGAPAQVTMPTLRAPTQVAAPPAVARGAGHGPVRRMLPR